VAGKKYLIISGIIVSIGAIYFSIGTKNHDAQKDFNTQKQASVIKTGEKITLLVKNSASQETPKVVELFGEIDQHAITVTASMPSIVKSIRNEGDRLEKNQPVVRFINDVTTPIPFDGKISNTFVKSGQNVNVGEPLFIAIPTKGNTTDINIEMPIAYIPSISKGMNVQISHNEKTFHGTIQYISQYSQQESGWTKVVVTAPRNELAHNTVVKVNIELSTHFTHFVPKTAIFLKDGKTFVKILNDQSLVESIAAEVIQETQDGFFIAGLPNSARIIIKNPSYASDGKTYQFTLID
jgi:biotin carboxyl carrier protein